VPANAVAKLYYMQRGAEGPGAWRLAVDGHPELTRELSGDHCAVLSRGR
jgi:hypothetical protein